MRFTKRITLTFTLGDGSAQRGTDPADHSMKRLRFRNVLLLGMLPRGDPEEATPSDVTSPPIVVPESELWWVQRLSKRSSNLSIQRSRAGRDDLGRRGGIEQANHHVTVPLRLGKNLGPKMSAILVASMPS